MPDEMEELQTALVECFDIAIPQAMPWMGSFEEKAAYAARVLPFGLRGLLRFHESQVDQLKEKNIELCKLLQEVQRALEEHRFDAALRAIKKVEE